MEIWNEPLRGDIPPAGFDGLPGIDRARAFLYNLVLPPSVYHLMGIKLTQVGPGSAVLAMGASPWRAHGNGQFELSDLIQGVIETAALTIAEPWRVVVARTMSYAQVRLISSRSVSFVGRGEVVRAADRIAFCRATAEDSDGRLIAQATGTVEFVDAPETTRGEKPRLEPVDPPRYPTPDPRERPLPARMGELFKRWIDAPVETLARTVAGEEVQPPAGHLIGCRYVDGGEGWCEVDLVASRWLRVWYPWIDPGNISVASIFAAGAAIHTLSPGEIFGILSYDLRHLRVVPADGRIVRCRAEAERHEDYVMVSGEVRDGDQVVTGSSMYSVALPARRRRGVPRSERKLASVLYTDIVASTATNERLGDRRWTEVLEDHHTIVRRALAEFGGREIKTTGDGFLATFDAPTEAIRCASAIRSGVRRLGIDTKAGVHTGEVEVGSGDLSGIAVNVAARVLDAADPGEVLVSRTVRDLVAGSSLAFADRGSRSVKGVSEDVHLFALDE